MKGLYNLGTAISLSLAYAAQAALVLYQQLAAPNDSWRFILGAAAVAAAAGFAWLARGWMNAHADMLLLMGGFGGLGMLLGNIADGTPSCHLGNMQFLCWMNGGMIIGGFLPAIVWSRCLRTVRHTRLFLPVIAVDSAGMYLGMASPYWLVSSLELAHSSLGIWAHPLALGAMLAGMMIAMAFNSVWLGMLGIGQLAEL
jgi:hypothetical protein